MTIVLNGTTGITNDGGYTGDGVVFADTTPANTLVTTTGGRVGVGTGAPNAKLTVDAESTQALYITAAAAGGAGNIALIGVAGVSNGYQITRDGVNNITHTWSNQSGSPLSLSPNGGLILGGGENGKFSSTTGSSGNWAGYFTGVDYGKATRLSATGYADFFYTPSGFAGYIGVNTSTNTTSYVTASDYRLKENIRPMVGALEKVARLKPSTYVWKQSGIAAQGFIAHELQEVVPECVSGEKDAVDAEGNPFYQGIDTSFLVATLTAAIQEQQAIITALTARVAALEGTQP